MDFGDQNSTACHPPARRWGESCCGFGFSMVQGDSLRNETPTLASTRFSESLFHLGKSNICASRLGCQVSHLEGDQPLWGTKVLTPCPFYHCGFPFLSFASEEKARKATPFSVCSFLFGPGHRADRMISSDLDSQSASNRMRMVGNS